MNDMDRDNRNYDYRDGRNYRDDEMDYRDYRNYRNYRDYDRRGGRRNYRNYRNYREEDFYEELEMYMDEAKEQYRRLEDIADMAENPQDKTNLMKIAEREKEHCRIIKEMIEK